MQGNEQKNEGATEPRCGLETCPACRPCPTQLHEGRAHHFDRLSTSVREMAKYPQEFEQVLVHTEPYYDDRSKVLREDEGN